jgi:hypothetical protein
MLFNQFGDVERGGSMSRHHGQRRWAISGLLAICRHIHRHRATCATTLMVTIALQSITLTVYLNTH